MKRFLWVCVLALGLSASDSRGADDQFKQVKNSADEIDSLLKQGPRRGYVQDASGKKRTKIFPAKKPEKFYPVLSEVLKMEDKELNAALKKTEYQLSDVIFAKLLSAKTGQPFEKVLKNKSTDKWLKELVRSGVPLENTRTLLDSIYVELAVRSLDSRM